jgi:hypothetical protein
MADAQFVTQYIGPYLSDAFDDAPVKDALDAMANRGGDELHEWISQYTPIRTGNLATSWYRERTKRELHGTAMAHISRVATDVDYAPYVNYGTGLFGPQHKKYLIEPHPPKTLLVWTDPHTGRTMAAPRVWHPGSPGSYMVERGVVWVESTLQETMAPELEKWKAAAEVVVEGAMRGVVMPK